MPRFLTQSQFNEVLSTVPCRKPQTALLDALLSARPPALLAYGPTASGKSTLLRKILDTSGAVYAWVDCDQCNTTRIMLQRAIRGLRNRISEDLNKTLNGNNTQYSALPIKNELIQPSNLLENIPEDNNMSIVDVEQITASRGLAGLKQRLPTTIVHGNTSFDVVTENINAFFSTLQLILEAAQYPQESKPLVLVLDRVDQLNDNPSDMYACLTRVRELAPEIRSLTTIFVNSTLEPKPLIITHVPHIRFTPYTTDETITILEHWGNTERKKFLENKRKREETEDTIMGGTQEESNNDDGMYGYNGQPFAEYKQMVLCDVFGQKFKNRRAQNWKNHGDDRNNAVVDNTSLSKTHICIFPQKFVQNADPTGIHQKRFWEKYVAMIVHALNSYTGSDIRLLKEICLRIWPAFIYPVISGLRTMSEFQALWRECKYIFQTEIAVQDELIYKSLDPLDPANMNIDVEQDKSIDPQLGIDNVGQEAAETSTKNTKNEPNSDIRQTLTKNPASSVSEQDIEMSKISKENEAIFGNSTKPKAQLYGANMDSKKQATVLPSSTSAPVRSVHRRQILPLKPAYRESNELPLQSKYILIAAYLASYNPSRFDIRFFSRAKEARAKRRDTGRRKLLKINPRLLAAPAFDLERMLAILHAIAPAAGLVPDAQGANSSSHSAVSGSSLINKYRPVNLTSSGSRPSSLANPLDVEQNLGAGPTAQTSKNLYSDQHGGFPSNIDIGVQIATLTTLRLIICLNPNDPLDSRTRWKINASWPLVNKLAQDINLDLKNYLIE